MKTKKRMSKQEIYKRLTKDRKYADWWSIIHIFFGILIALILKSSGLVLFPALTLGLLIFTTWEIIEPSVDKHLLDKKFMEKITNQISDIIFGTIGFLLYWWFLV